MTDEQLTKNDAEVLGVEPVQLQQHLGWTKKQGGILTGGGKAEQLYTAERGFPFDTLELPHTHLIRGTTHRVFDEWKSSKSPCTLVTGAWNRPLFAGGFQHSTDQEEETYNLQSLSLFVDLRVPRSRSIVLAHAMARNCTSLEELTALELRVYARQHVFAGFTVMDHEENSRPVATRHHAMDWNFVGTPRPRPNKWWIQPLLESNDSSATKPIAVWKELAYATDEIGQPYYFERWERLDQGGPEPRLALRKARSVGRRHNKRKAGQVVTGGDDTVGLEEDENDDVDDDDNDGDDDNTDHDDGILVMIGDHFNYVLSRKLTTGRETSYDNAGSLVDLVDEAVKHGDLATARSYLTIEAGHGRVSTGWKLNCAIPFWNEGKELWTPNKDVRVKEGPDNKASSCKVVWKEEVWDIYDCSFDGVDDLKQFLLGTKNK